MPLQGGRKKQQLWITPEFSAWLAEPVNRGMLLRPFFVVLLSRTFRFLMLKVQPKG